MRMDDYEYTPVTKYAHKKTEEFWDHVLDYTWIGRFILKPVGACILIILMLAVLIPFYAPVFGFYYLRRRFRQRKFLRFD